MNTNKNSTLNIAAAILFAVLAVWNAVTFFSSFFEIITDLFDGYFRFSNIPFLFLNALSVLAPVLIAFSIFTNKRNILTVAGFGILTLPQLIYFFQNIFFGFKYFRYYSVFSGLISLFSDVVYFIGFVGVLIFAAVYCMDNFAMHKNSLKQLWFAPAICLFIPIPLTILLRILSAVTGSYMGGYISFSYLLHSALFAIAFALTCLWLKSDTSAPAQTNPMPRAASPVYTAPVQTNPSAQAKPSDIPDEIRKYKELCDANIITQEEFELKKKQLLGL